MQIIILAIIVFTIIYFIWSKNKTNTKSSFTITTNHQSFLNQNVQFYSALQHDEKKQFEYKIAEFLSMCKITGIETDVSTEDKLLIASSAVIPIFSFPNWQYTNLDEVLLYPSAFNEQFNTDEGNILGMVGTGYMEGKMILSKQALHNGFSNSRDKKNTAIHEFVHLIDKMDGVTDGIPAIFMEHQYSIPWMDLINKKVNEICEQESDINPYGATNTAEFLSVASEYFFERPKLLKNKHPELYQNLERIFKQSPDTMELNKTTREINRNDCCPCGSGKKYKKCCGKNL